MFRTIEQRNAAIQAAEFEQAKRVCIAEVYQKHQDFIRCDGNDRAIVDVIEEVYGPDVVPKSSLLDDALAADPDEIKRFARQPLAKAKEQVIDEYLELLAAHSRQDRYSLDAERKRLNHLPLEVCRQKLDEMKRRQKMGTQSTSELKQMLRDANPYQSNFPGYPNLPTTMWDSAAGKHVTVDAAYLNGLARNDVWQLKKLCRIYGSAQIDFVRGIK